MSSNFSAADNNGYSNSYSSSGSSSQGQMKSNKPAAAAAHQQPDALLPPGWIPNDSFQQALILLRANVIALCLRSGLRAETLWPPEAILLNMKVLEEHCHFNAEQISKYVGAPTDTLIRGKSTSNSKSKSEVVNNHHPREFVKRYSNVTARYTPGIDSDTQEKEGENAYGSSQSDHPVSVAGKCGDENENQTGDWCVVRDK
jgi:hypothetical protein